MPVCLHRVLVQRLVATIRTVGLTPPPILTGGVARNPAIARLPGSETGENVPVPPHPQRMGAWRAALVALAVIGEPAGLRSGRPSIPEI